jgi:hypothetical protein
MLNTSCLRRLGTRQVHVALSQTLSQMQRRIRAVRGILVPDI